MRVLELSGGVATSYAAKLLADEGAEVIKAEPLTGDSLRASSGSASEKSKPESGFLFSALNVNKRGVAIDYEDKAALGRLLNWADLVVHGLKQRELERLELDADLLLEERPHLVVLSITPFGLRGSYSDYSTEEINLVNAGGWANLCPATEPDPNLPPLKPFGEQSSMMAAISAAATGLAYLKKAKSTGQGEAIDFSIQEYVCSVLEVAVPVFSYKGDVISRIFPRSLIPWKIFQAKDRPIFIACIEQDQWERLVEFMGNPEWASLELFLDQPGRAENQDMVHAMVQEFVGEWLAEDLYHAAQQHRICVAPVMDFENMSASEHLRFREFFEKVELGELGELELMRGATLRSSGRASFVRAAPDLGEHNEDIELLPERQQTSKSESIGLPLEGVRVLDMTWAWAGPFCSLNLAHLGAEVIRIESAKRADLYRRMPVFPEDWEPTLNNSGMFNQWNQGKSSISVDLGHERGLEIVRELVAKSDVLVQNFATGVLDRLGLGYDELKSINPRLVLVSISGYGQTGPYREYMGYGPAMPPLAGLSEGTGYIGGGPQEMGLSMPDPTAGITGTLGVVSALIKREQTGEGDHLDISLWEATAVLNLGGWMDYVVDNKQPKRNGNRSDVMAPHGCYPCKGEDAWVSIAVSGDEEWHQLAKEISKDLQGDPRFKDLQARKQNEDALDEILVLWTQGQDKWSVTERLQAKGVAAFPTMTTEDIVEDPHLLSRGFIERLPHPEVGEKAHTGIPWITRNTSSQVSRSAPCLGADTDRYLRDLLGYDDEQVDELYGIGAVGI